MGVQIIVWVKWGEEKVAKVGHLERRKELALGRLEKQMLGAAGKGRLVEEQTKDGLEADVLGSLEGVQGMSGGYEKQAGLRNVKEKLVWSSGWEAGLGNLEVGCVGLWRRHSALEREADLRVYGRSFQMDSFSYAIHPLTTSFGSVGVMQGLRGGC